MIVLPGVELVSVSVDIPRARPNEEHNFLFSKCALSLGGLIKEDLEEKSRNFGFQIPARNGIAH
jgi:hypothetical protein